MKRARTGAVSDERPAGCFRRAVRSPGGGADPPRLDAYWTSLVTTGDGSSTPSVAFMRP
jgi:hypothetical protein